MIFDESSCLIKFLFTSPKLLWHIECFVYAIISLVFVVALLFSYL